MARPSGADARIVGAAYLLALFVLIANDHVFKDLYGGVITGKLSDFAGLFAVAVFAGAIMPHRARAVSANGRLPIRGRSRGS